MKPIKCWPVIRHFRWWWGMLRLSIHLRRCQELGLGWFAQQGDLDYLQGIWDGKH